jgi:hypothetical protein
MSKLVRDKQENGSVEAHPLTSFIPRNKMGITVRTN